MPVDREMLQRAFEVPHSPRWLCPTCAAGHLATSTADTIIKQTAESIQDQKHPAADHEWVRNRFTLIAVCDNAQCEESVIVSGRGVVDEWHDEQGESGYSNSLTPEQFHPPLRLIRVPKGCPSAVDQQARRAEEFVKVSPSASVTHVRTAVEFVLDDLRIPRVSRPRGKKATRLSTHARIERLPKKFAKTMESLLAAKWIGNAGVHESDIEQDVAFDALDILELVLQEVYDTEAAATRKLVKEVNKRKGPARRRRGSRQ